MSTTPATVLITGATGMVGAYLCLDVLKKGKRVRGLRRAGSTDAILKRTFEDCPDLLDSIEWITGDVTDVLSVQEAMSGIEEVYHAAGMVSFDPKKKKQIENVNVTGTANVVNMALECGIRRLCHLSSVASLGRNVTDTVINETASWTASKYNTWYAVTKYAAEREVWRGIEEGLDAVIVNPSIILGPGNWDSGSGLLFRAVQEGLRFYPQGTTGFVDVRDVSRACIMLMEQGVTAERFILNSENVPYQFLFSHIATALHVAAPTVRVSPGLAGLAWRAERIRSFFTGSYPKVTRETAYTSSRNWYYDNAKVKQSLGIDFIPVKASCDYWADEFIRSFHP